MVIIMCVTVSVAVVSAARGLEGRSYGGKIRSKLVEHIFDRIVGSDAKSLVSKFSREMPISQMPRKAHEPMWVLMPDFNKRLWSGLNP